MNMGRNSPDLLEPNEYKARYAFGPFKIREPTYALRVFFLFLYFLKTFFTKIYF